jgi:hypothetical protein
MARSNGEERRLIFLSNCALTYVLNKKFSCLSVFLHSSMLLCVTLHRYHGCLLCLHTWSDSSVY